MKKQQKYVLGGIAVIVVVIVFVIFMIRPKNTSMTPNDYVTVSCSGLDGEGKAQFSFDTASFLNAVEAEKGLKPAQKSQLEGLLSNADQYFQLSEEEGLSNGEEILITSQMPSDFLEEYGITLKNQDLEYTVAGLTDVQTVNLGDYGIEEYLGFEGHGVLSTYLDYEKLYQDVSKMIQNIDDSKQTETYIQDQLYGDLYLSILGASASQYENLSNGDTITVSYTSNEQKNGIEEYGIVFETAQKEVTVEGLEEVETVSLIQYLTSEFSGYDGAGELNVSIDWETMKEDLLEMIGEERNGFSTEEVEEQIESYVSRYFTVGADKTSGISNGEKIRIFAQAESEESYIQSCGIELEGAETTVTSEDLEEPEDVDLMDSITVTFLGICPKVQVNVSVDETNPVSAYIDRESYDEIPDEINAENGETLEITLGYEEEAALKAGYRITNNTREYEISGLPTYDVMLDLAEDKNLQEIKNQGIEETRQILLDEEEDLLNDFTDGTSLILWNQVKVGWNKIVKWYSDRAYYDFNKIAFVYEAALPIQKQDGSVSERRVYVILYRNNMTQSVDGILDFEEEDQSYFYDTEEKVEEIISAIPDSIGKEEGSQCQKTEVMNEQIEEELKITLLDDRSQTAEIPKIEEATAAVSQAVIPEVPQEIAQNASAVLEYDGHRYYRFDTPATWKEAEALCEEAGGSLVSITSWTEQSVVSQLVKDAPMESYWIGGTDEEMESVWKWTDEESFTYQNWRNGKPDHKELTNDYACIRTFDQTWEDKNNEPEEATGYILEISARENEQEIYLTEADLLIHESNVSYETTQEDSYGNSLYGMIKYDASNHGWTQYQLNGNYQRLTGEIAVCADAQSDVSMDFAVFGDGKLLYRQTALTRQTKPSTFTIDVRGVDRLTIETRNLGGYSNGNLILSKAKLYESAEKADPKEARIRDLVLIDGNDYETEIRLWQDSAGAFHDEYLQFDARNNSTMQWNLNGEYETFSGKLTTGTSTGSRVAIKVQIYGDDELLFEREGYDKTKETLEFSVDVSGKEVLKIVTEDTLDGGNAYLYLVDDLLMKKEDSQESGQERESLENSYEFPVLSQEAESYVTNMVEYGTHRYFLFEMPMTWEEAEKFCEEEGGHLAVITSPLEQRRIEKLTENAVLGHYWIGASDEAEEGTWTWVTGERMDYLNWADNQPSNSETAENITENDMELKSDGTWDDRDETQELGFILEFSNDQEEIRNYEELVQMEDRILESNVYDYQEQIVDSHGIEHLSSYVLDASNDAFVSYDLNGEYTEIRGSLSTYKDTQQNADMSIAFFGDGELLYSRTKISGWEQNEFFRVDVTGVKTLTIKTRNDGDYSYGWLLLNDTIAVRSETPLECSGILRLAKLQTIDSVETEYEQRLFEDSYGNLYEDDYRFRASNGAYAVFLLGGDYTEFSGTFSAGEGTNSQNSIKVEVYADEQLVFEQDGIGRTTKAVPFTLDVTGIHNLKIVTSDSSEEYEGYLYLAGDGLQ